MSSKDLGVSSKSVGLEKREEMKEDSQESVDSSEVYSESFESYGSDELNIRMKSEVASRDDTSNQTEFYTDPTA